MDFRGTTEKQISKSRTKNFFKQKCFFQRLLLDGFIRSPLHRMALETAFSSIKLTQSVDDPVCS